MRFRFVIILGLSLLLSSCALIPSIPMVSNSSEQTPGPPDLSVPEGSPSPSPAAPTPLPVVLVMDASGSMRQVDVAAGEVTRMQAAREAAKAFVADLTAGTPVGLVSYGDRTPEAGTEGAGLHRRFREGTPGSGIGVVRHSCRWPAPFGMDVDRPSPHRSGESGAAGSGVHRADQ